MADPVADLRADSRAGSRAGAVAGRRLRVIGIGPGGPDQVTLEAVAAMRACDWFLVLDKAEAVRGGAADPLLALREEMLARHVGDAAVVVRVEDPPRERRAARVGTDADYRDVVETWHLERTARVAAALRARPGDVGFLVWGDPAFYDSTLRVLDRVAATLDAVGESVVIDVLPGISALQLLAARHRIVLHEVARPLHVTTGRALLAAVEAGQDNVVVMLNSSVDVLEDPRLADWTIWWGADLGTPAEELVAGPVAGVLEEIRTARERARSAAGWVMDVYLLRASAEAQP